MTLQATLVDLESALWTGGADLYERTLIEGAQLVVPFDILDRDRTIEAIAGSDRWDSCELEDVRVVELGEGAAVLAYRASARRSGASYHALVSTAYVQRDGRWMLAAHHQTPIP